MATVDEVLSGLGERYPLRRVSAVGGDRQVRQPWLAETLQAVDRAPAAGLVVLSAAASAKAGDYQFDMALRVASLRDVAAIAVSAPWLPSATAADIADHARIALIESPAGIELTGLLLALSHEIEGGAAQAMRRAALALDFTAIAEPRADGPGALLAAAGTALGCPVELVSSVAPDVPSAPVTVAGETRGHVQAPEAGGELATAARLALPAVAAAVARVLDAADRAADAPARSRGELLATLLLSDRAPDEDVLLWSRQAGLRLDAWHLVVRIELDWTGGGRSPDQLRLRLDRAARAAWRAVPASGWVMTTLGRAMVLAHSTGADPGPQAGRRAARVASAALDAIAARLPDATPRAGIGSAHEGLVGLRASAAEARTALAARQDRVAAYDSVGIARMLIEWYASDTAREAVRRQLAPLEQLGGNRARTAIETLRVYLDEQGSIARTAAALHLHRNAVAYRLQRIAELTGLDLDDPDHRLALQLACRARMLAS